MEEDGQTTPFWLQQSSTYFQSSNNRRRSSICLNSGVLIVVLVVLAILIIFIVIPSFLAFTSQVFRPNLVKKSWDSLNLVLVLFAILCGILGRKRDDGETVAVSGATEQAPEEPRQQEPVQQQWFGYADNRIDDEPIQMANSNAVSRRRLKRNSSSYPDLRQESSWASPNDNWRYFDDSYVYNRPLGYDYVDRQRHQHDQGEDVVQESGVKTIPVDTYVTRQQEVTSSSPARPQPSTPPSTPPPPPPPPPPRRPLSEMKPKARHDFQSLGQREKIHVREMESKITQSPPATAPPPPLEELRSSRSEKMPKKHERKKSGGAKDITSTLASLYNQRKRKKKQRSKENFDDVFYSPAYLYSGPPPSPPPPPPPPPPPASVFHQLFKKGSKSKRIHSLSASSIPQQRQAPPPPPPPPPPMSPLHPPKVKTHTQRPMSQPTPMPQAPPPPSPAPPSQSRKPMTPGKPPLPSKINSFYEESYNAGNQSPLIPMPPPPPPPPFKVPGFKFIVKGDYVRLLSNQSSRSNSPDLDTTETPPTSTPATPTRTDDGEAGVSAFCPSPDVNTKADTFIARFRAGLRMEKVHSFKEKQETSTSGLKPSPRSNPNQIQT